GERADESEACVKAGVDPTACAPGFEWDAGGCAPVLPPAPCAAGMMALAGETACRPVATCAGGTWGDIPVGADTQYVDGSYAGGDSDGSAPKPWTTIAEGLIAASDGAIIAVAAGTYPEDLTIEHPVRVWGRCPSMVSVEGRDSAAAAFLVLKAA